MWCTVDTEADNKSSTGVKHVKETQQQQGGGVEQRITDW